jgi:hypothetical protein
MGRRLLSLVWMLVAIPVWAGPVGMFQGELMGSPQAGWLYVKGRNGMLRRVELGKARILYGRAVPLERRDPNPTDELIKGAVVKVTAEQGADGEWRAREVVLVHLGSRGGAKEQSSARLNGLNRAIRAKMSDISPPLASN